jgi:hypothetical protein
LQTDGIGVVIAVNKYRYDAIQEMPHLTANYRERLLQLYMVDSKSPVLL